MANFLTNLNEEDRAYVRTRIGVEAEKYWEKEPETAKRFRVSGLLHKEKWRRRIGSLRENVAGWLVRVIAGNAAFRNFQTGLFRSRGEVHQWMYDRYSLKRLLEQVGFKNVKVCTANESRIPGYEKYSLDSENGVIRKPDSLYMEASKP